MKELRHRTPPRARALLGAILAVAVIGTLGFATTRNAHASTSADTSARHLVLTPLPGAPAASGSVRIGIDDGSLQGSVRVEHLPAQPYGSGHFYGVWFVRTDTGDKAFLNALQHDNSIIFSSSGSGRAEFSATHYTTGPDAGSTIAFGPKGTSLFIVLIETTINGLTPSPIAQAASATF